MLQGFKNFIMRGNVMELAVGIIIGAAFTGIVNSLVKDIITPILGLLGGQPDFSAIKPAGIGIGNFVNSVISFLMIAAALYFFIITPFNTFLARMAKEKSAPPPAPPTPTESLLAEIRDLLKKSPVK
jgi:large conductance mechanosensitive channel